LVPTRIYVRSLLDLFDHDVIKAIAHITGGGVLDNVPRVLPEGVVARIDSGSWQAPAVFRWLYEVGQIKPQEMLRVFNCGIGMVLVIDPEYTDATTRHLSERGETVYRLGEVAPGDGPAKVQVDGLDG
jgi:phosphoribosylformylglycinamidine cyclo-ligase